jgi:hypothetical protein
MQLVCVAEVTVDHEIKLDENIKSKLNPGEKIRLKIESIDEENEWKRKKALKLLREISMTSKLGLYKKSINREDAHDRDIPQGI